MKNKLLIGLLWIILLNSASAANFLSINPNQPSYKDGDLMIIYLRLDDPTVTLTVDMSTFDPYFTNKDVRIIKSESGYNFTVIYPIAFNTGLPDGLYPVLFSAYNPIIKSSDALTYNVQRKGSSTFDEIEKGSIVIKLREAPADEDLLPDVPTGTVLVCFPDGRCITKGEQWYTIAENTETPEVKINRRLDSIDQQMGQITTNSNANANNIKNYLDENSRLQQQTFGKLETTIDKFSQVMINQTQETQDALKRSTYISVGGIIGLLIMTILILYILYMRYQTSWFYW